MENASKALIIAGAVLIAILLISIGVIMINSTDEVTGQVGSTASTMAIETFNSQFTNYEGTISASQVKSLVSKIRASNSTNEATSTSDEKYVELVWTSPLTGTSDLKSTRKYKVSLDYAGTGYVSKVTISQ